jgi:hypothetical protein
MIEVEKWKPRKQSFGFSKPGGDKVWAHDRFEEEMICTVKL